MTNSCENATTSANSTYLVAEQWLNIISNPNPDLAAVENEKMKAMQQRIEALEQIVKRFEKMTDTNVTLSV
jgi:hypothetical protein